MINIHTSAYSYVISGPSSDYFKKLEYDAQKAIALSADSDASAWSICSYIDSVDAGDIYMNRAFYAKAVQHLSSYLSIVDLDKSDLLSKKSWAAHTLLALGTSFELVQQEMPLILVA